MNANMTVRSIALWSFVFVIGLWGSMLLLLRYDPNSVGWILFGVGLTVLWDGADRRSNSGWSLDIDSIFRLGLWAGPTITVAASTMYLYSKWNNVVHKHIRSVKKYRDVAAALLVATILLTISINIHPMWIWVLVTSTLLTITWCTIATIFLTNDMKASRTA
jgi:hypothetical protein